LRKGLAAFSSANFELLTIFSLNTMPYLDLPTNGKKRKRNDEPGSPIKFAKSNVTSKAVAQTTQSRKQEILALERPILDSRKHYNNIAKLLSIAKAIKVDHINASTAAFALCRVFCRLHAAGHLEKSNARSESDVVVVRWLHERQNDFTALLAQLICINNKGAPSVALKLWMRLVKEEVRRKESAWTKGQFAKLIRILLTRYDATEAVRDEFVQEYFRKFRDVQFYTLELINASTSTSSTADAISCSLDILFELPQLDSSADETVDFFATRPEPEKGRLAKINAYKKRAQDAWLCILRSNLNQEQRRAILLSLVHDIVPLFPQVERLADFLTDSYNVGGSTSLLALSGVFYLIQEKNLDYPSFYQKLYSLLDEGILHSKYRSRFFRLLDTFMSSTHLPAALVASFIKRLSRLALHAPPASIVAVVPWIYNMFKKHPQCTYIIHRVPQTAEEKQDIEEHGFEDPFDMDEPDPMKTNAIDSSIWEIETLQSHYHPNVATLAKIISDQFTKQSYNLEDFLDHSYATLLDAELEREVKKTPVVEYQIPKRIFTGEDEEPNDLGRLLTNVMKA
jgi:U3 small nucleolar RNA-associated protein 19